MALRTSSPPTLLVPSALPAYTGSGSSTPEATVLNITGRGRLRWLRIGGQNQGATATITVYIDGVLFGTVTWSVTSAGASAIVYPDGLGTGLSISGGSNNGEAFDICFSQSLQIVIKGYNTSSYGTAYWSYELE